MEEEKEEAFVEVEDEVDEDESAQHEHEDKPHYFATLDHPWLFDESPRTLMIRKCYPRLLRQILKAFDSGLSVLLCGFAGIGKTQFQAVLIERLSRLGITLVVDLVDGCFILINPKAASQEERVKLGDRATSFRDELKNSRTVYLFDAREGHPVPLKVRACTIVTASPSRGSRALRRWADKRNTDDAVRLYMPPWSLDELLILREKEYPSVTEEVVRKLFDKFGGSVRRCLTKLITPSRDGLPP